MSVVKQTWKVDYQSFVELTVQTTNALPAEVFSDIDLIAEQIEWLVKKLGGFVAAVAPSESEVTK